MLGFRVVVSSGCQVQVRGSALMSLGLRAGGRSVSGFRVQVSFLSSIRGLVSRVWDSGMGLFLDLM